MTEHEKERLLAWCKTFDVQPIETDGLSKEAILKANQIYSKFQAFILWSEKQLEENI